MNVPGPVYLEPSTGASEENAPTSVTLVGKDYGKNSETLDLDYHSVLLFINSVYYYYFH